METFECVEYKPCNNVDPWMVSVGLFISSYAEHLKWVGCWIKKCIEVEDANNSSVFLDSVQDVMVEEKTEIGHPVEMLTAIDHDARHK